MNPVIAHILLAAHKPRNLTGQVLFESSVPWVVPDIVTSICAVAVARGQSGYIGAYGGGMAYRNGIAVTPGETLYVDIEFAETRLRRGSSYVLLLACQGALTPASVSDGAQVVGHGGRQYQQRGGGAGGYGGLGGGVDGDREQGGGGVGLLGQGASSKEGGAGGSGGMNAYGRHGGDYGGGGAVLDDGREGSGGKGGLRILWGPGRAFPSTLTHDL